MSRRILALAVTILAGGAAGAEEGMWTFNRFPAAKVKKAYGFEPTQAWLDRVRLSSARIAEGCSASFVSGSGLIMTNHHCARRCIQAVSSERDDMVANGFVAQTGADEKKCPTMEVDQLVEISDVTGRVKSHTAGLFEPDVAQARKAETAKIEEACRNAGGPGTRCNVVSLYGGGVYDLYKYRRYQDVRLVFAPEAAIGFFGGDADNFTFPRYDLDVAFLRVYENDRPLATPHHFTWSPNGAADGEIAFVSGHPGSTQRKATLAELTWKRDHYYPFWLQLYSEYRGYLTQFQQRGPEQKRVSGSVLFGIENALKASRGEYAALLNRGFLASKQRDEDALRAKVAANPQWKKAYGGLWGEREALQARIADLGFDGETVSNVQSSVLLYRAVLLIRLAAERAKSEPDRLPGYGEGDVPSIIRQVLSMAPVSREFEIEKLSFTLAKVKEALGPDHALVRGLLGPADPRALAREIVEGTSLDRLDARNSLLEGGSAALAGSTDPMVRFALKYEAFDRTLVEREEKEVRPPATRIGERLAEARFAALGTSDYPDATFTLRLSYGRVQGYTERGQRVAPFTDLDGAYRRATGTEPFALPKSWIENRERLDLTVPFNLVTTNDITGGNSGSPMINRDGQIVGLVFDGNIHSLGGAFGFDEALNRAVAVDSRAIKETLKKIYKAERLLAELP